MLREGRQAAFGSQASLGIPHTAFLREENQRIKRKKSNSAVVQKLLGVHVTI